MAFDARIGEKRGAERTITEPGNAAPRSAQIDRVENGVRENDRPVGATQKNFAHEHSRATVGKQKTLVTVGTSQSLKQNLDPHRFAAHRNAGGQRTAVGKPWPITARAGR